MYKVRVEAEKYNSIEFVFDNMEAASDFMRVAIKSAASNGLRCTVEEYAPLCELADSLPE